MKIQPIIKYVFLSSIIISIVACNFMVVPNSGSDPFWDNKEQMMILDFEEKDVANKLKSFHTVAIPVSEGVTSGKQALRLDMEGDQQYIRYRISTYNPIDATNSIILV